MFDMKMTIPPRIVALFLAALVVMLISCSRQTPYPSAPQNGQDIIIDASLLESGTPKFYTYHFQGKNINYFLLKIDNKVSSFLDACMSCYSRKRGYSYEDGVVTCRSCGVKFPVYKLEKGIGGCYPIKFEGRMDKGVYRIPVATLEKMADKF
jgi:uncharacterized membrane protein